MKRTTRTLWLCAAIAGLPLYASSTLPEVMEKMDRSAAQFRGMTAKLKRVSYTAVIKDTTEEIGTVTIRLNKPGELQLLVALTNPDEKTWAFRGRKAELYIPKIKTVQEYDLGKHGRLIDQFLLLGFGSTSAQLSKNYSLALGGEEVVAGQKTTRIELTPKSDQAREHLKRVEIWFPAASGNPVQQKFYLASGDYMLVTYSEAKLEPNLPESAVRLSLPKDVKREYPQK